MDLFRSILHAIFFYPGTAVFVLLTYAAAPLGIRPVRAVTHGWVRYHRLCAALILGIRVRVTGTLPRGAVLVAAKHQSMLETLEVMLILKEPAVVMKQELAEVPGWGFAAVSYGIIPVDRAGGAAALRRMLRAALAAIADDRPIVIFPEGTRVPLGERPPLQPGFAGLYSALRLPVVPVALDSGHYWPRRGLLKHPGTVTIAFGEPIPPGLPRHEIERRVHEAINVLEPPPPRP
jgi:1-acyl-sn-glycerol-3-phosphate acyltransferase